MGKFYQYNKEVVAKFDLNFYPIYRIKGQEWPQLPGLMALAPPRHTARGREEDHLIIYLSFSGNDPLSSNEYDQLANQMAHRFYHSSGSLTSAIRSVAQTLNLSLVDRNLRTTSKGQYLIGRLILGVMRDAQVVFAQCGPTHVFHLTEHEKRPIHDVQISGRGLGIGQATPLYFAQIELNPGDQLIMCADLPAGWSSLLIGENQLSPEALRRELLSSINDDVNAIQVLVQAGKGILNIQKVFRSPSQDALRLKQQSRSLEQMEEPETISDDQLETESSSTSHRSASRVENEQPASRFTRLIEGTEPTAPGEEQQAGIQPRKSRVPLPVQTSNMQGVSTQPARVREPVSKKPGSTQKNPSSRFIVTHPSGELPEIRRPPAGHRGIFRWIVRAIQGLKTTFHKISEGLDGFLPNLLPDSKEGKSASGGSNLAFFAIAIPLIIVTISGLVYTRLGRAAQFQENYNLALEQAAQAHQQVDPNEVRRAWASTLYYLELADRFQVNQDSLNLRQEAQTALDNLDGIVRLDFHPAIISGLSHSVQVSRMAATNTDLYLLDASRGSVLRGVLGGQGYEMDPSFECGPGLYGTINVGNLIDIETLQMSNIYNARLMAIDANGILLYCGFNMKPVAVPLGPPPLGWQGISAFTLDADGRNLYVLDPMGNAVWVYQGDYGKFINSPTMFFGQQVPQSMNTSIDIAANNSDLYLLFADGHISVCAVSHYDEVPLRCADPATFVDNRPERQSGTQILDALFSQISFATAPDPLLYLLEPLTRAVYFFSPRSDSLELRGQFRATVEQSNTLFNNSASAMTISPNRYILICTGNQVFYANNVP